VILTIKNQVYNNNNLTIPFCTIHRKPQLICAFHYGKNRNWSETINFAQKKAITCVVAFNFIVLLIIFRKLVRLALLNLLNTRYTSND